MNRCVVVSHSVFQRMECNLVAAEEVSFFGGGGGVCFSRVLFAFVVIRVQVAPGVSEQNC